MLGDAAAAGSAPILGDVAADQCSQKGVVAAVSAASTSFAEAGPVAVADSASILAARAAAGAGAAAVPGEATAILYSRKGVAAAGHVAAELGMWLRPASNSPATNELWAAAMRSVQRAWDRRASRAHARRLDAAAVARSAVLNSIVVAPGSSTPCVTRCGGASQPFALRDASSGRQPAVHLLRLCGCAQTTLSKQVNLLKDRSRIWRILRIWIWQSRTLGFGKAFPKGKGVRTVN